MFGCPIYSLGLRFAMYGGPGKCQLLQKGCLCGGGYGSLQHQLAQ